MKAKKESGDHVKRMRVESKALEILRRAKEDLFGQLEVWNVESNEQRNNSLFYWISRDADQP